MQYCRVFYNKFTTYFGYILFSKIIFTLVVENNQLSDPDSSEPPRPVL